jgi:hypothetical protein
MKKTCANYWYETVENVQSYTNLYTGNTNGTTDDGTGLGDTTESSGVERLRYVAPFALVLLSYLPLFF